MDTLYSGVISKAFSTARYPATIFRGGKSPKYTYWKVGKARRL